MVENLVLLQYDAASLRNRSPTPRRDAVLSSRVQKSENTSDMYILRAEGSVSSQRRIPIKQ